jgi:hypothetical protein
VLSFGATSQKLLGRVVGWSRRIKEVRGAIKKQSPPVRGIGSAIPSTLSQQLPRETIPKCANSVGEILLPDGIVFSSTCASRIKPHGAVASNLE